MSLAPGSGDALEEDTDTYSSILAWRIPWTEEHDRARVQGVTKIWTHLK